MLWCRSSSMVTICTGMWRVLGVLLQAREHRPAEHVGQEDVERDRVRPVLAHQPQRFGAAVGDEHAGSRASAPGRAARRRSAGRPRRPAAIGLSGSQACRGRPRTSTRCGEAAFVGATACVCCWLSMLDTRFAGADVVQRQVQRERAALARRALQAHFAAEQAGDFADDRKAQAGAAVLARGARVGLLERLEHDLLLLRRRCRCRCR